MSEFQILHALTAKDTPIVDDIDVTREYQFGAQTESGEESCFGDQSVTGKEEEITDGIISETIDNLQEFVDYFEDRINHETDPMFDREKAERDVKSFKVAIKMLDLLK